MLTIADIDNNFAYHAPAGDQAKRYGQLRDSGKSFAKDVFIHCPDSREKSIALAKIEEAVMWANAAIARNEMGEQNGNAE